jgi:hypothetical protein
MPLLATTGASSAAISTLRNSGLARGQVGHAQGFYRRRQADGGEIGQNQKAEGLCGTTLYNRRR